ncbi:MAG: hypothetical protein CL910_21365 [Deltaproteobacteria bacterium]|nr:hypothetical protein [Deltaproteobacteria bacterium]
MVKKLVVALLVIGVVLFGLVCMAGRGVFGGPEHAGEVVAKARPPAVVRATTRAQATAAAEVGARGAKQILFGDLHVHTTFSFDAFMFSLPLVQGEGSHPPADACDFARYCSALDFWSINDHAFSITPDEWSETVESIRQCNAVAGQGSSPDTVAFLGWEWTQVGTEPGNHYGHKNVILASTEEGEIPARPIAALRGGLGSPPLLGLGTAALFLGGRMHDLAWMFAESDSRKQCEPDTNSRDLPLDCTEGADTPEVLFRKLSEWGHDAIVIPHGTTWGFYTPPGSTWDKQLQGAMHDPERQTLIEVYSGHGDSEVYRDWRAVAIAEDGTLSCPEPSEGYLPSCWHAGELIRQRCLDAGEGNAECESRAALARQHAADARVGIQQTVPGSRGADWLDAGQCRDCDQPSFNYRPGGSAQYIAAIGNFDEEGEPRHFRMGFMASSDNHYARPGTGYKEVHRAGFTESQVQAGAASGPSGLVSSVIGSVEDETPPHSRAFQVDQLGFNVFETERQASFLLTGGLIAAHAEGRDRASIWDAMKRREVYGTSGPRLLLWFDLLNPPGSRGRELAMGGDVEMDESPIFQARAVGSFEQQPGCPDYATQALSSEELERICKGECYNPGETRRLISRIEVVRIRPQKTPDEKVASLIDDPWKTFACDPDPAGCAVTFSDPEFAGLGRDTLYYVRAFEEPAPGVNADNLRCERDAEGNCTSAKLCPSADGRDPDCLAEHEPRAWSSPIYVDFAEPRREVTAGDSGEPKRQVAARED